jgi:cation:H+ antiporter
MNILTSLILYILSFGAIWFGAGLIIKSVDKIARKLRLSSFAVSFFVLGLLTSIPETAVSINAVIDHKPEIFVGTLLGGIVVIFLFIIPLLAILGKGVKLNHDLDNKNLIGLLAVIAAPGLVVIDHKVTNLEGILLILAYVIIFYFIQRKHGVLEENNTEILSTKSYSFLDLAKVAAGIGIVFVSSRFIVDQTLSFADILGIPAFYISIIVLSLGANIPEISIAVRAIISGKKDIAFGDYLGSAAANALLFGIFTLVNDGEVFTFDSFIITFVFIVSGLGLFYNFAQSKEDISKKEGLILLGIYIIFVLFEIGNGLFG